MNQRVTTRPPQTAMQLAFNRAVQRYATAKSKDQPKPQEKKQ